MAAKATVTCPCTQSWSVTDTCGVEWADRDTQETWRWHGPWVGQGEVAPAGAMEDGGDTGSREVTGGREEMKRDCGLLEV